MTQLGELRDAHRRFVDAGVKVYAVSYDDVAALAAFAAASGIPYALLSDADSAVIKRFGIRFQGAVSRIDDRRGPVGSRP